MQTTLRPATQTPPSEHDALCALLAAASLKDAERAVASLVAQGYTWTPLGGKEGNFGLVNIGSDPTLALIERVTNAIDAVIDHAAAHAGAAVLAGLHSPRDATNKLFGVSEGRTARLADAQTKQLAQKIVLTIRDGHGPDRPTLEIRDRGSGIAPHAMPETILNLAGTNKIAKPYLAGAYGQGGSTTFAFSPRGCTIASATGDSDVGVTLVRYRELDARRNKNGRYEYLVRRGTSVGEIPRHATDFDRGTLVRHFEYDLPAGALHACEPGGLGGILATALFDPVLPFTVVEARTDRNPQPPASLIVRGCFADLDADSKDVEYSQSVTCVLRHRRSESFVQAHYWVLAADDSPLFPDHRHPVVVTNFGQAHGFEDRRFIVDELRLPFLKNALVVHIELDALAPSVKRELLSSTRDRLKRGAVYRALIDGVREALLDDGRLEALNAARRRRLLERQAAADQKRLRRRFAELMEKFYPGAEPAAARHRNGGGAMLAQTSGGEGTTAEPLPSLMHPTFVRIGAKRPVEIPAQRTARVLIESDAPDGYVTRHAQAQIVAVAAPFESVEFVRATDFRGGRARVTVRGLGAAGDWGAVTVQLTDASGAVLSDSARFTIVAPPPPAPADNEGGKGIRVPEIYEIHRPRWPEFGFDEASVAAVNESSDSIAICVNMDNVHLQRLLTSVQYQEHGLARMRMSYLVQIAFYAFLQQQARSGFSAIDEALLEGYERLELDRVARTVVTAIASVERIDSASLAEV